MRARAERAHHHALFVVIHVGKGNRDRSARGLGQVLLQHPVARMTGSGVRIS